MNPDDQRKFKTEGSLSKTNQLKRLLDAQHVAFGAQLRFGSPAIAELFGLAGFDFIVIDGEHAPQTPVGVQAQLQGIGCSASTPFVRLGKNDPDLIRLYLDMGAMGVVVPFVNTAEQAKCGAQACRYPPAGTRGWGPSRAAGYGLNARDYTEQINDQVMYVPIIESAEAVANIDSILAVEGVDSFLIGPADLSISLGAPFQYESTQFQAAVKTVREAAHRAGKTAGIGVYGDAFQAETIARQVQAGFRLLLLSGDEPILSAGCRKILDNLSPWRG